MSQNSNKHEPADEVEKDLSGIEADRFGCQEKRWIIMFSLTTIKEDGYSLTSSIHHAQRDILVF